MRNGKANSSGHELASFLRGFDSMPKHFTVSDGELVLFLWPAEEGGYNVTSPLDPALVTQAETFEEAFIMAHDAWELLKESRSEENRSSHGRTTGSMSSPEQTRASLG
jgi:predicted RNase H-like HicB family nuclease